MISLPHSTAGFGPKHVVAFAYLCVPFTVETFLSFLEWRQAHHDLGCTPFTIFFSLCFGPLSIALAGLARLSLRPGLLSRGLLRLST